MKLPSRNMPRWSIFFIDIFLSILSLVIAYLIRFDFIDLNDDIWKKEYDVFIWALPFYLFIRGSSYLFAKTYAGILRYTSTQDTKRIFITVSFGTLLFILFSILKNLYIDGTNFLPISIIVVEYLVTLFLLLTIRMIVKLIYLENQKSKGVNHKVLVYGAGKMGMITKNTLEGDTNNKFNVIGFIDDDQNKCGKMLGRSPIISLKDLEKWTVKKDIKHVIIAIKNPSAINKRNLVNECLKHNVKISSVPPLNLWMDGGFTIKQIQNVKIEDLLGRDEININNENISLEIKNKIILVSGAAGSIGSELCRQILLYSPKKLILLDQAESQLYDLDNDLKSNNKIDKWEIVIGDITNSKRMKKVFNYFKPEIIFHSAAYKHVPLMELNPSEAIRTNLLGTKNLVDLSIKNNIKKFVFISTDKAVNPTNIMGASKRIAEIYVQSINKDNETIFITTRFGNVLGSNGSVIPLFKKQIDKGGPVTVTDENVTRYFMTIPEACQLVLEAGNMGNGGEIFVFDMGESVKILDLAKKMIKLSGLELNKDIKIEIIGLRPGEKLYEELLSNAENTLPTHHSKILIGKVKEYSHDEIKHKINSLIDLSKSQLNDNIVKSMKDILPEFISKNSDFSKFDTSNQN